MKATILASCLLLWALPGLAESAVTVTRPWARATILLSRPGVAYLTLQSASDDRLIGLTGSEAETAAAAHAFRVFYEPSPDAKAPDGYLMAHSGYIYLMTPKGKYQAVYLENGEPGEALASDILMFLAKGDPS